MKAILCGSAGYWGQRVKRVVLELGHDVAAEINLPDKAEDELRKVAKRTGAEAAFVITPPATHYAIAVAAMQAGLHVFIEKPMALSAHEAQLLAIRALADKRVISVDSTFVHSEITEYLRTYGMPDSYISLRLGWGPDHVSLPAGWDLAVHDVAILLRLGAIALRSNGYGLQDEHGKTAQAAIDLLGGGTAQILVSREWHEKVRSIVIRFDDEVFLWEGPRLFRIENGERTLVLEEKQETLARAITDFADRCGRGQLAGITDGAHGASACSILERLYKVPHVAAHYLENNGQHRDGGVGGGLPDSVAVEYLS